MPEETCPACGKPVITALYPARGPKRACSDPECIHAHGIPEHGGIFGWLDEAQHFERTGELYPADRPNYVVGFDPAGDGPHAVTVVEKLPKGAFRMVDPKPEYPEFQRIIQQVINARIREQQTRHEAFLKTILAVTDDEQRALHWGLVPAVMGGVMVGGRGHGKKLRAEVAERIIKRMEENPLPDNFWNTVAAYNMLNDPEGRRLVKAIIDRKAGCDGTPTDR